MGNKNVIIQEMINNNLPKEEIIEYVKNSCQTNNLTPKTLGMLFEVIADIHYDEDNPITCYSDPILIDDLKEIHPGYKTQNGCSWARSDNSYLGNRYVLRRRKEGGSVVSVQLDGPNKNSTKRFRRIRKDIREKIEVQKCVVLNVSSNIEIDHKSGKYETLDNIFLERQNLNDFQPMSKAVNDAKRQHCKKCNETGKRFDAKVLGYLEGFIVGDENSKTCPGCYWYDPKQFNKEISRNFKNHK